MDSRNTIAPNPYVYPSKAYYDLEDTPVRWSVVDGGITSLDSIKARLQVSVALADSIGTRSGTDGVLEIFSHEEVCFGLRPDEQKTRWRERLDNAIREGALSFSIFGFPFKMPVPLKTHRISPDAAEVASLLRLYYLMERVSAVAGCDAALTIFAEDGFAPFVGLKDGEEKVYFSALSRLVEALGISSRVRLVRISDMETTPLFPSTFQTQRRSNLSAHENLDPDYLKRYEGASGPISRLIDTREASEETLAEVYSGKDDQLLSPAALAVRERLKRETPGVVASYFAYLQTRDVLDFPREIAPGSLPLTVSPKEGRLGVFPINRSVVVLPYHGVPVMGRDGKLSLEYLFDLKRTDTSYRAIYLDGDIEKRPFLYEI